MNPRALVLVSTLVAASLAGCLDASGIGLSATPSGTAGDGSPSASASPSATSSTSATPTPTSGTQGNHVPQPNVTVKVGSTPVQPQNGSYMIAQKSNVSFDASASSDADGDPLAYAWTVDGAAKGSNATFTVELDAGTHIVTVAVSDGHDEASQDLTVIVAGASAPAPSGVGAGATVFTFKGSFAQGDDDTKTKTVHFDVPASSKAVTLWLTWDDGILGNSPILDDLDLFLAGPDGKDVATAETSDFEYIKIVNATVVPGSWSARVLPYGDAFAGGAGLPTDVDYALSVIVWNGLPLTKTYKATATGGVNTGLVGEPGTGTVKNTLAMPDGTNTVSARLTWTNAASAASSTAPRRTNDFDLTVSAGGKQLASSGNGFATEFAYVDAADGASVAPGTWTFEVVPFEVITADWTLTVDYL